MVSKVIFVLAAVCLCGAIAKPSENTDGLQNLANQMTSVFETFSAEFKKAFDIKDTKESKQLADNLKSTTNELAGKLSGFLEEIKSHSGDVSTAVEGLKTKVSETVKKLQETYPAEAAKAKEYEKQIEETYNSLVAKAKETAAVISKDTSGLQEDLHKFTENVVKEVKTNMEKVNAELKKAIDEHAKEHKH